MEKLKNDSKISVSRLESTSKSQETVLAKVSFNRHDCTDFYALDYATQVLSDEEPNGLSLKLSSDVLREERVGDIVNITAGFERYTEN